MWPGKSYIKEYSDLGAKLILPSNHPEETVGLKDRTHIGKVLASFDNPAATPRHN